MFRVDKSTNRIIKLDARRFSDLGLGERGDLQEWIAGTPETLGEELLIIQKEFDGFADTRERLDLLALDKDGKLVIIENKLDETGREVVWQAIKYAAYCSSLNKAQIVEIYQRYLDHCNIAGNAETKICEFLDKDSLDDVDLNADNDQRVMLIAGNFRKEVTATVLWLLGHGVRAQCFRVVPYCFGEEIFVDLQQIIPTPEVEDFMISMATKGAEKKSTEDAQRRSHKVRLEFWEQALGALRARRLKRYQSISPSTDHWLSCATGVSGCNYTLIFLKQEVRVELTLQRSRIEDNKWFFDRLEEKREEIESDFGEALEWNRMGDKKSSKIRLVRPFDGHDPVCWPEIITWFGDHISRLEDAFSTHLERLNQEFKSGDGNS